MALANRPAALPSHAGSGVSAHLGYSKLALLPGEVPRGRRVGLVRAVTRPSQSTGSAERPRSKRCSSMTRSPISGGARLRLSA